MSGDSVSGRADQLRSAASAVPSGAVNQLHTAVEQLRDQLAFIIGDDSAEVVGQSQQQADAAAALFRNLMALREALNRVADYHTGAGVPASAAPRSGAAAPPQTMPGPSRVAPDGSEYPDAAADLVEAMPPRVKTGELNQKTVGYVKGEPHGQFTSGRDETWTPRVAKRLRQQGLHRHADYLSRHTEMKVAAWMIKRGRRDSEVVINHEPCGFRFPRPGCHSVLERFLPRGYVLTVHGTSQHGAPFTQTYRGQA